MIDLLIIVWLHFIADFILQQDYVAVNKSKDNKILLLHVAIYSVPFLWFGWLFAIITLITHFVTDYVTSRWTANLWQKDKRHEFFVVVGLDQAIHLTTLLLTYYYLIGDFNGL